MTPWSIVYNKELTVTHLVCHHMYIEPEGSSLHSQEPIVGCCPWPIQSCTFTSISFRCTVTLCPAQGNVHYINCQCQTKPEHFYYHTIFVCMKHL